MSGNDTAGNGVSNKDRLKSIGNGWDMNVANMIFSYSALATRTPERSIAMSGEPVSLATAVEHLFQLDQLSDDDIAVKSAPVHMTDFAPREFASALATSDPDGQTPLLRQRVQRKCSGTRFWLFKAKVL